MRQRGRRLNSIQQAPRSAIPQLIWRKSKTGVLVRKLPGQHGALLSLAFSPTQKEKASGPNTKENYITLCCWGRCCGCCGCCVCCVCCRIFSICSICSIHSATDVTSFAKKEKKFCVCCSYPRCFLLFLFWSSGPGFVCQFLFTEQPEHHDRSPGHFRPCLRGAYDVQSAWSQDEPSILPPSVRPLPTAEQNTSYSPRHP